MFAIRKRSHRAPSTLRTPGQPDRMLLSVLPCCKCFLTIRIPKKIFPQNPGNGVFGTLNWEVFRRVCSWTTLNPKKLEYVVHSRIGRRCTSRSHFPKIALKQNLCEPQYKPYLSAAVYVEEKLRSESKNECVAVHQHHRPKYIFNGLIVGFFAPFTITGSTWQHLIKNWYFGAHMHWKRLFFMDVGAS